MFRPEVIENRHKSRMGLFFSSLSKSMKWVMVIIGLIFLVFGLFVGYYMWRASDFNLDDIRISSACTQVLASDGSSLGSPYRKGGLVVKRDEIPEQLVQALLAREDEGFYDHNGVDFTALLRSLSRNIKDWSFTQGGSTLTMQLVRNAYELREKTIDRKILEMFLARRVERKYSKNQILEAYLNRVYFGAGAYGVGDAAQVYFAKSLKDLTLGECAMLAGILRGPSIFNPFVNKDYAVRQRNETLVRMADAGFIEKKVADAGVAEELKVAPNELEKQTNYPLLWIQKEIADKDAHEKTPEIAQDTGVFLETSFDIGLQRYMERTLEMSLLEVELNKDWTLPIREKDDKNCVQAMAMVVIPSTGDVLGYIGGRDPMDGQDRWDEMPRKLGSLFMPIVNLTASENSKFIVRHSPIQTLRSVGEDDVRKIAEQAGLSGEFPQGNDLALGMFSRNLSSLVPMFLAFQNNGYAPQIHSITRGLSPRRRILYQVPHIKLDLKDALLPLNSNRIVYKLPPFQYDERKRLTKVLTELPENEGYFVAYLHRKLAVFLWLGQDKPTQDVYESAKFKRLMRSTADSLAFDIMAYKLPAIKNEEMGDVQTSEEAEAEAKNEKPEPTKKSAKPTRSKSSTKKKR